MINKFSSTVSRQLNKPKKLKILTCPTHEGYQSMLAETGHEFYMLTGENIKPWDFHTRPLPKNHYLFGKSLNEMRGDIYFDLILCQNRLAQYGMFAQIADRTGLPIVMLDHTEPFPGLSKKDMEIVRSYPASQYVFITDHNKKTWGFEDNDNVTVIPHGINTKIFNGYTGELPMGISVVNHFAGRDIFCGWNLWQNIASQIPIKLVGENPGISSSINNIFSLTREIGKHRFFLNTSQLSPVPLSLLEAMAIGCPPVSTAKQEIPKIIQHGVNGLLGDTPEELKEHCQLLINNPELARELGSNARQTIIDKFGIDQFVNSWNKVFEKALV